MRRYRKIVTICLAAVICLNSPVITMADNDAGAKEIGIACVGDYSSWNGKLDDLKSPINIANDFANEFADDDKNWKVKFKHLNNLVWETDFKGKILGGEDHIYADNVDILIYSGHGIKPNKYGSTDYAFALNTKKSSKYANQSQMYFGDRDLEWLVTFTCNFLASKDLDTIGHMAKGVHAICGFETTVILTADMGKVFAKKLKKGYSVKESFFATAEETRIWYKSGGTAGVFTTKNNADDCLWGYGKVVADPARYSSNSSGYVLYSYKY